MGVVVGFLLGGLAPRIQAADLEAERDQLLLDLALAQSKAGSGGRARPMLPVPGMNEVFEPRSAPQPAAPDGGKDTGDNNGPDGEPEPWTGEEGEPFVDPQPIDPASITEEFNLAVDAQRLRASQSRAALAEQADLSDAELEEFDLIMDDMNAALAAYGEDLMALALSGEEPSAEEMLGLTHDVTGILYSAQTQVNDLIGADGMADADPGARQVWNHLDLEVFRDAVEGMAEAER